MCSATMASEVRLGHRRRAARAQGPLPALGDAQLDQPARADRQHQQPVKAGRADGSVPLQHRQLDGEARTEGRPASRALPGAGAAGAASDPARTARRRWRRCRVRAGRPRTAAAAGRSMPQRLLERRARMLAAAGVQHEARQVAPDQVGARASTGRRPAPRLRAQLLGQLLAPAARGSRRRAARSRARRGCRGKRWLVRPPGWRPAGSDVAARRPSAGRRRRRRRTGPSRPGWRADVVALEAQGRQLHRTRPARARRGGRAGSRVPAPAPRRRPRSRAR